MPSHLRPALLCCATLSLAAHAVLLDTLKLTPHVRHQLGGAAVQASPSAAAMQFRTVQAAGPASDTTLAVGPAQATGQAPIERLIYTDADTDTGTDGNTDVGSDAEPAVAATTQPDIDAPAEPASMAAAPFPAPLPGHNTEAYIPRPQLSIPPVAQTPVLLSAPEGQRKATRRVGVLALYINEAGRVHHIEPDEPRLPPDFERVARDAFLHTVFTPGQVDGRIVKSRIRVEVVFDNTPLDDAPLQGSL